MTITTEQIARALRLVAIEWHLQYNFVSAYPITFAPILLQAIDNCSKGKPMALVEYDNTKYVSAQLVEDFRLEDMVIQVDEEETLNDWELAQIDLLHNGIYQLMLDITKKEILWDMQWIGPLADLIAAKAVELTGLSEMQVYPYIDHEPDND